MSQIIVSQLSFSYDTAYDMIFENVSFQIDTDWKLGFIGRNGRGKTTFLNLLMGKYEYRGDIMAPVNFDYFPFEIERIDRTTMDIAKDIIAPFREWEQEMELCLLRQQQDIKEGRLNMEDSDVSHHMNRYGELQELYQKHDGYIIEELIEKELGRLK